VSVAQDLADRLAADVLAYVEATGDEEFIREVTRTLADMSQTFEEAFVVSLRVQRAERRARAMLVKKRRAAGIADEA
jgi:hypothetical protein